MLHVTCLPWAGIIKLLRVKSTRITCKYQTRMEVAVSGKHTGLCK
jgi:hypothetical protein